MKWNHLPEPGGLYAQHPDLLEDFFYIFRMRSEHDANEAKKQKQNMGKSSVARSTTARRSAKRR